MDEAEPKAPYWSQDASALAAALGTGPVGLTSERAAAQLALVGPNSVEDASRLSALRLLLRQFESPLVLILAVRRRDLAGASAVGGRRHHPGDRPRQLAAQLLSGIPGVHGRRGTEKPPRADLPRGAGRDGADGARQHGRARRPHPALGRQSDPGRWPRHRGGGLPRQRSEHDGRVVPGREAARDRSPGRAPRRTDQCGLSRRLGAQRHGEGPRRRRRAAGPSSARSRRG